MDKEELVEYITSQVIAELSKKTDKDDLEDKQGKKKILLVIEEGKGQDLLEVNLEIKSLKLAWYYLDKGGKFNPSQDASFKKIAGAENLDDYGLVVIYNPGVASLSKAAHLISEGVVPEVIVRSIEKDKPVVVIIDKLKEMTEVNAKGTGLFKDKIREFMRILSSYGLNLISSNQLKGEIAKFYSMEFRSYSSREVITKEDIVLAYQQGRRRLVLKQGAIITPLARDEAKRYGIEVVIL